VPLSNKEKFYIDFARKTAIAAKIPEAVAEFVFQVWFERQEGLGGWRRRRPTSKYRRRLYSTRYFRNCAAIFCKPFVEASATNMPVPDNSFDALWSI